MIHFSPFVVLVAEKAEQIERADRERKLTALFIQRCDCQKKEPASKVPKMEVPKMEVAKMDQPSTSNYLPSR